VPDAATIDLLVRAGGWTLFVFTIALIAITGIRGDWVFGWIYRRSEERNAKIEAAFEKLMDLLAPRKAPRG
jgi:hypothetical protein